LEAKTPTDELAQPADDVDRTLNHEALTDAVMMAILQGEELQLDAKPALVTELPDKPT
jgi:hypothetical protein